MFEGFKLAMIDVGDVRLRVRYGGEGPPLVLLHGHPQTHVMWHGIAPHLAESFTVVCPDMRGFGDSSKPPTTPDHAPYSKRALADDIVALMQQLEFDRFAVAGHDRGGRVAFRLALDHPGCVARLAVLDIIPAVEVWRRMDMEFGLDWWHWFFLAQPYPLPERMIGENPDHFYGLRYFREDRPWFDPEAVADYQRCVHDPATIHGMCEHYRANATYDVSLDEADRGRRRIRCPLFVLWSARDEQWTRFDVLSIWRGWADDVKGQAIDAGHFFAEEAPDETRGALRTFFTA